MWSERSKKKGNAEGQTRNDDQVKRELGERRGTQAGRGRWEKRQRGARGEWCGAEVNLVRMW